MHLGNLFSSIGIILHIHIFKYINSLSRVCLKRGPASFVTSGLELDLTFSFSCLIIYLARDLIPPFLFLLYSIGYDCLKNSTLKKKYITFNLTLLLVIEFFISIFFLFSF